MVGKHQSILTRIRARPYGEALYESTAHLRRMMLQIAGDLVGRAQLSTGYPLTVSGSSRLACEQWKISLASIAAPKKGDLLLAAVRNRRWVEWAIFSGAYLLRMGYRPKIVYSGAAIERLYGRGNRTFWTTARTLPHFEWIDLDMFMNTQPAGMDFVAFAQERAHLVAAYNLGVEDHEPEQAPGEYEQEYQTAVGMLERYGAAVHMVLSQHPHARLICPSGLIGETLSFYEAASRLKHETVYVEGWSLRPGHNIWNLNSPALEYDIVGWMRSLGECEWNGDIERDTLDFMAFREGEKVDREGWLDNFHQVQRASKNQPLPPALDAFLRREGALVLLGTNVIGDSSTLDRQTIFRSQQEWLSEVIAYFKQKPQFNLIVRAHPDEVWQRARLRLGDIARQHAGDAPNIFVVSSEDEVNTFALIDVIDVGLAWVSNVGLDMALRGKPVVMAAKPKFAGLGVVHEPIQKEAYFALIEQLTATPISPSEDSIHLGKLYHHIVFKLISLDSDDPKYQSSNYRLGDAYQRGEQHKFYQILAGELDNYGQPLQASTP